MLVCPSCGAANRDGARFCDVCGSELAGLPAAREQRKTVTVLFCDVTGSTALGERLDPESLRHVLARYFDMAREAVERHGGTVEKFIGDAVMAVFGVPVVHEDDALRCARAAVEIRDALGPLNVELGRDYGTTLELRIGVTTGEVVAGTEERLATGDAVNVAARLEQAAAPGEILIGETTLQLVRAAAEVEAVEPLELHGKSEAVRAFRLLSVREGVGSVTRNLEAPMVGRADELDLLRRAWERTTNERSCHLFTVLGPAGVGKSRLAAEFLDSLGDAAVVRGRCLPYGEGITYWPVVEVLKQILGPDSATIGGYGLEARAGFAIRSVLGDESVGASAEEIAWAVRKLLETVAEERPLVCVFDDVHWGEETFLDLVEHIADLSRDAPILLLCMGRPELLDRRSGWGGGKLNATAVLLEPLSADQTDELIERLVLDETLDDALRGRIREAAEGNPLFVEEMVAMLDGADGGKVVVPPTIHALLAARLDQLDSADRGVLERGSVEGRIFHRGVVQVLGPDEEHVMSRLTTLVRKELVRPDRTQIPGDDAFRFRHLLIRDAAYEGLPKATRAELHERFASWLEAYDGDLVERDEILGYHLEQAYRFRAELGPLDAAGRTLGERAGERLAVAGRRAHNRGDTSAAIAMLERAWSLLPPEPVDVYLGLDLADALFEGGRLGDAVSLAAVIAERAAAAGDTLGEWAARLDGARLGGNIDPSFTAQRILELVAAARDDLSSSGDDRALAVATAAEMWAANCLFQPELVKDAAGRLVEIARRAGDVQRETTGLMWLMFASFYGPTPVGEALRMLEDQPDLDQVIPLRRSIRAHLLAMLGRFDEARLLSTAERAHFAELGAVVNEANALHHRSTIEMLAGEPAAAERFLRDGCDRLAAVGERGYLSTYVALLGEALYALGRLDEAEECASRSEELGASDDVATQMVWRQLRAKVRARRGAHALAIDLASEAVALGSETSALENLADAICDLAEVFELAGRREEAVTELERAVVLHERKGNLVMAIRIRERLTVLRGTA